MKAAAKEHNELIQKHTLAVYDCFLVQVWLNMNLETVAHLCPITACGMICFGGLLSKWLPCCCCFIAFKLSVKSISNLKLDKITDDNFWHLICLVKHPIYMMLISINEFWAEKQKETKAEFFPATTTDHSHALWRNTILHSAGMFMSSLNNRFVLEG